MNSYLLLKSQGDVRQIRLRGRISELTAERQAVYAELEALHALRWWQLGKRLRRRKLQAHKVALTELILGYLNEFRVGEQPPRKITSKY